MIFKTLDLEKDLSSQGYTPGSYDLVVASNVLHATRELDKSLRTAHSLLKPGGFLLICEITTLDVLHVRLPFSCLPGWWLGREDGRPLSATIDTLEWNERLLRTGFSGLDVISDEANTLVLKSNIMLSQAINDRVQLLREPLLSTSLDQATENKPQLVIVGGQHVKSASLASQIIRLLNARSARPTWVRRLEDLADTTLSRTCSVIHLGDLDKPALEGLTEQRLRGLKTLFEHPRTILWVTQGCKADHPMQNMSVGLGRVLMVEMPTGRLQFLDFANGLKADSARHIAEAYLRWKMLAEFGADLESGALLWTTERELVYDDDIFTVPRIAFDRELNQRYMASRKLVTQQLSPTEVPLVLQRSNGAWNFTESVTSPLAEVKPSSTTIKVAFSSVTACYGGLYAIVGTDRNTEDTVVALSSTNGSFVAPVANLPVSTGVLQKGWETLASALATELQVSCILDHVPFGSVVVLEEPTLLLALAMNRRYAEKLSAVIFLSGTEQPTQPGLSWVVVPRHAMARSILSIIPSLDSVTVSVECNESLLSDRASLLDRVVPRSCWKVSLGELVTRKGPEAVDPMKLLSGAFDKVPWAIKEWPTTGYADGVLSRHPGSLNLARDPDNATSLLIDWVTSPSVSALVEPIDSYVSFSPNKTYILFGLTSDLGLSIVEWLVAHGARHVALTSRSPKIEEAWSQLMEDSDVNVKVFAKCVPISSFHSN